MPTNSAMTKHYSEGGWTLPGPVFGHIPGYPVGSRFENRAALAEARVHRHRQAGISGSASKGADSIVLSGGYEDDQDLGNLIIYTGQWGPCYRTSGLRSAL